MAELSVIGSGTGIPSLKRGSPGLLVFTDSIKILIDSGPGTLRKMLEAGITYRDPDLLLLTHLHPDHIADLVPTLFACKYGDLPREKALLCMGGPGFKTFFEKLEKYMNTYVIEHNKKNTIHLKCLESFDEDGISLMRLDKNE